MAFRQKIRKLSSYDDPEALFRDRRNRTVQGPLSHQSDILRRYHKEAFDKPNVALELPTGSGKTLVGLLIAEFRRVTKQERVLYLCPTKQLVLQVCEQSQLKYGIEATPFVGKIKNYDNNDKLKYQTAETIAVAPYSALFNVNPFFDTPQFIILDDAHASENYIASNWSLEINRKDYNATYFGLLNIIGFSLPESQKQHFLSEGIGDVGIKSIEKVPTVDLLKSSSAIIPFLDKNIEQSDLRYPWQLIRDHLEACHIYVSYDQILIRPYIPPSLTHAPFANA
jgi:superfamily II DNA or RNA helicase